VDGLRGLATLMIVVFHCWVASGFAPLDNGLGRQTVAGFYVAVDLFFVLSGFLPFLPMWRKRGPGSGRSDTLPPFGRLPPAYFLCRFIAAPAKPWVKLFQPDKPTWGIAGLSHLFMLQTPVLGDSPSLGFGSVGQVWTLSNEAIFYVALFFIARAFV